MTIDIHSPAVLKIGGRASGQTADVLRGLNCRRPLVVTDAFVSTQDYFQSLLSSLHASALAPGVFSDTVSDPTSAIVTAGADFFRSGSYDSLIAMGGGSTIDTAKAIGILVSNGGEIRDYPTTADTGSEVTRFAVITESRTAENFCLSSGHGP
ncbi:MAG: iron-containing alcohol dehydrogenase [Acidobacteriaceae bacterium]